MRWYQSSSIPVLLAVLLAGYAVMLLGEMLAAGKGRAARMVYWAYGFALLAYCAVYLYLTFFSRTPDGLHRIRMIPFYGLSHLMDGGVFHLKIFREHVLNVLLYVPLGAMARAVFRKHPHPMRMTLLTGLICSVLTEAAQYGLSLGLAEMDDLINNTMGTLLGLMGFVSAHAAAQTLKSP